MRRRSRALGGALVPVTGYTTDPPAINAGLAFGFPASGIRPDGGVDYPGTDAFVFVDDADVPRFPPIGRHRRSNGRFGRAHERRSAFDADERARVAAHARAQIRRPLSTPARVTIAVVDTNGAILGMVRSRDAPVFGADVSLQKARIAALMSSNTAATFLDRAAERELSRRRTSQPSPSAITSRRCRRFCPIRPRWQTAWWPIPRAALVTWRDRSSPTASKAGRRVRSASRSASGVRSQRGCSSIS